MVFVTLGTQDKSFERALIKIETLIKNGIITEEVVVQAGTTKYQSNYLKIFSLIDSKSFNMYIKDCEYMISHGGVGAIMRGINKGKKIIAVARRVKYGEHENDHQVEIVKKLDQLGYIIGCTKVEELEEKIALVKDFHVQPYISNNKNFCRMISQLIDKG
ncbi:MAG: PssE/Cps14G family polysaccharide biosynthesis glycosyltransferase [Lachnospiraceae bacterium]